MNRFDNYEEINTNIQKQTDKNSKENVNNNYQDEIDINSQSNHSFTKDNKDILYTTKNIQEKFNKENQKIEFNFEDEIIKSSVLVYEGNIKNERFA